MYEYILADINQNHLAVLPARNRKYSFALNKSGAASFVVDGQQGGAEYISARDTDLLIYRAGSLVWGGRIMRVVDDITADDEDCSVQAVGYLDLFGSRYIRSTLTYTAVDQGQIAWNLINHTQGFGDLGVTQGSGITTGVTRDRTYYGYERKEIKEALQQLAAVNDGFDFEITPNKVFNIYYPKKQNILGYYELELGKNIRNIRVSEDGVKLANVVFSTGAGDGSTQLVEIVQDPVSQTQYGVSEMSISKMDISVLQTLIDKGNKQLNYSKVSLKAYELSVKTDDPPLFSYNVGDKIRIIVSTNRLSLDEYLRVFSIDISIDENEVEKIKLVVGKDA